MTRPVIKLSDVAYRWPGPMGFSIRVPRLDLAQGETLLLLGQSGSGKSTLLSLLCGTILPDSGKVQIAGTDLTSLPARGRDRFRAEQIGVIFQQFNLLPFGTVADNICLPLRFAPSRRKRAGDVTRAMTDLCAALGLPDTAPGLRASTLSVGQQQRVAVARALIGQPPLIIADEPTSALDADSQIAFLDTLFAQARCCQTAVLMVSHDQRISSRFDRVVQMTDIAQIARGAE